MVKKVTYRSFCVAIIFCIGIAYGCFVGEFKLFPYDIIRSVYINISEVEKGPWSVGVYKGETPFSMIDSAEDINPVLTANDVTDTEGVFVADPFFIKRDTIYYMFFEMLNRESKHGDISYATSSDFVNWKYERIIIDEPFHLSYPLVFEEKGEFYIIPESNEDNSVRLYKATHFPDKWEYVTNLLEGYDYNDPTTFKYNGKWWMFTSNSSYNMLHLFYADSLLGEWRPHPESPLRKYDKHYSNPSGRMINIDEKLYRVTQDCDPYYGKQVFCFEILSLTDTTYAEKMAWTNPLIKESGKGWNAKGMHHIDVQCVDGEWIGVVDGQKSIN